jgi:hypothetical protein
MNAAKIPKLGANLVAVLRGTAFFLAHPCRHVELQDRPEPKIRLSALAISVDFGSPPRLAALKVKAVLPKNMLGVLAPQARI